MKRDARYKPIHIRVGRPTGPEEAGFQVRVGSRSLFAPTDEDLYEKWQEAVKEAESYAQRELTADELKHGVQVEDKRTTQERNEQQRRHFNERNPPPVPDSRTSTQLRVDMLTKQVEEERRAKLSEAERNLEDAIAENEAAIQRAALLDSAGFKKATDQLERLEFATLFDPKIGGNGMRPEVAHQKAMFERTLDVAAATINIAMIRQSLQEKLEPDRLKLQKSEEARAKLLKAPLFDHVSTEMVGDREYVNLTKGDRTVAVSRERFDGRESDEALAAQVFEVPANV